MEKLHEDLIRAVKDLYNGKIADAHSLGNSANAIYEIESAGRSAILRMSPFSKEKEAHVAFELSWMEYLNKAMTHIAGPIPSVNNRLYEIVSVDGETYILSLFIKAPGKPVEPCDPQEWHEGLFKSMGELMGRLHLNTKDYVGRVGISERFDWRHNYLFAPEYTRLTDPEVEPYWEELLADMERLPCSSDVYGIIHNDFHHLNFHLDNGSIMLFDFDDCEYSWYVHDIASACFFVTSTAGIEDEANRQAVAEEFLGSFLRGYLTQTELPQDWPQLMDLFLRYRMLAQYKFIINLLAGVPEDQNPHKELVAWLKARIISGQSFVAVDYEKIAANLF